MNEERSNAQPFSAAEARYRIKNGFSHPKSAIINELSETGLRFVTDDPLAKDTLLEINLNLPGRPQDIPALGRVEWQKPTTSKFLLDTQVRFVITGLGQDTQLLGFLKNLKKDKYFLRNNIRGPFTRKVQYRLITAFEKKHDAAGLDIGIAGMRITTAAALKANDNIKLRFSLAPEAPPINTAGRIMWCKDNHDGTFTVGVRFVDISRENAQRILDYLIETAVEKK